MFSVSIDSLHSVQYVFFKFNIFKSQTHTFFSRVRAWRYIQRFLFKRIFFPRFLLEDRSLLWNNFAEIINSSVKHDSEIFFTKIENYSLGIVIAVLPKGKLSCLIFTIKIFDIQVSICVGFNLYVLLVLFLSIEMQIC